MKHRASGFSELMTFLVFAMFSLCTLLLLLTGARVYRSVARRSSEAGDCRTAVRYLTTRVHQSEDAAVEAFGDTQALVLGETAAGKRYLTRVYCYDGYLMELYTASSGEFAPDDGEKLFPMEAISFLEEDDLLVITVTLPHGERRTISLCTKREVLP